MKNDFNLKKLTKKIKQIRRIKENNEQKKNVLMQWLQFSKKFFNFHKAENLWQQRKKMFGSQDGFTGCKEAPEKIMGESLLGSIHTRVKKKSTRRPFQIGVTNREEKKAET